VLGGRGKMRLTSGFIRTKNARVGLLRNMATKLVDRPMHHPDLLPVCTENLSSGVVVVKSAKDGA
jgi:hypothetical protein